MSVASGLDWYDIDSSLVLFILGNGTALLGIDAYQKSKGNE